jgi:hypothetical protein
MEIPGPTAGIFRVPTATGAAANSQWQPGQLLLATVTGTEAGKALLAIGNRQAIAETSLALQTGQQLTLLVRSLGQRPILEIVSRPTEPAVAAAIRLLLPKQGNTQPLLASLGQLWRTTVTNPSTAPAVPAEVTEASRSLLAKLPQPVTISSAHGLKEALRQSGLFMENSLSRPAKQASSPVNFNTDLKANLLRLVQVVRNWPGTQTTPSPPLRPPAANGVNSSSGSPAQAPAAVADKPQKSAAMTAEQLGRLMQPGLKRTLAERLPAANAPTRPSPPRTGPNVATEKPSKTGSEGRIPPPFRGTIPVPQPPLRPSLDLSNADNLRSDLLRQIEASLSRLQMQQLAAVPREGERSLAEWLLDLPVRRGEDIDLWSMRWFRDPETHTPNGPDTQGWSVQLAFDLPGLGPIQVLVQLQGEQVNTRFWAQLQQTPPLLRAHLGELRQALQSAGLQVGDLDCHAGSLSVPETKPDKPFIQEKA